MAGGFVEVFVVEFGDAPLFFLHLGGAVSVEILGDRLTNAFKANVRLQVQRLQASPVIASAVQAGKLKVVGAYYDLDTGAISLVS